MIGLMKDELGGNIMTEFVGFRPKACSYLIDDGNSDTKAKGTKKTVNNNDKTDNNNSNKTNTQV